jgi:hypothetical protein
MFHSECREPLVPRPQETGRRERRFGCGETGVGLPACDDVMGTYDDRGRLSSSGFKDDIRGSTGKMSNPPRTCKKNVTLSLVVKKRLEIKCVEQSRRVYRLMYIICDWTKGAEDRRAASRV